MRKNKRKVIIVIILIIILMVLGTICVISIKKNDQENNTTEENNIDMSVNNTNIQEGEILIDYDNLENAKLEDGIKINTSEKVHQQKTFEGLRINQVLIDSEQNMTNFSINFENISDKTIGEKYLKITCLDKSGNQIGELYAYVSETAPGEIANTKVTVPEDYINMYDYQISEYTPE